MRDGAHLLRERRRSLEHARGRYGVMMNVIVIRGEAEWREKARSLAEKEKEFERCLQ